MRVLLTGANGYIGKRLLPILVNLGHEVICCVRDKNRMTIHEELADKVRIIEVDFLKLKTLKKIPADIDGAYYLIHSMSSNTKNFDELESVTAYNFREKIEKTNVKHVIYLGGIVNETKLSKHLNSRKKVENILSKGAYSFTALNAGIILGSGSASFEIIRSLVEKFPFMIAPKWLLTKSQPIAIRNVIQFLSKSLFNEYTYNNRFDIGGPDILTYKEMLIKFGKIRNL
ncbi:MAG: NAD(P)H-binding protein, partial [Cyclobacteriaceae bacterium]|nr:NAD(P)H-binding protein [Cyclobacteriaceae bacterium]